jgi:hypothetical protein
MWRRSVRATDLERRCGPPGDELIPEPIATLTHAITIRRPAREVWPWLVQMGAGSRAGWYSYDIIDNARRESASRIVPELQHVAAGTLFPALPGAIVASLTERQLGLTRLAKRCAEGMRVLVISPSRRGGLAERLRRPFRKAVKDAPAGHGSNRRSDVASASLE